MAEAIDTDDLRAYLSESLPPDRMARVEKALRDSSELRARLEDVRQNRGDSGLHTLGAIWRRGRLTCPTRQQLGSFLLDALDPDLADYLTFHLDVVGCPYCRANLADLKGKADQAAPVVANRRRRIFHSSQHLLSSDG
jgi:anti-sigma factor RsiW